MRLGLSAQYQVVDAEAEVRSLFTVNLDFIPINI